MSQHHHHNGNALSRHSQKKKFQRIEWMRRGKRWLRKSLIVIIILLVIAVILSYIFITKEPEPKDLEINKLQIKDF